MSDLRANEHVLRPAALRAGAQPEGHVSLSAAVLLRLLDEKHQLGRSLSRAEEHMFERDRTIATLREEQESWRGLAVETKERAERAEVILSDAKGVLAWALKELDPGTRESRPGSVCDVASRGRRKATRGRNEGQPVPKAVIDALALLLSRLENERAVEQS